MSEPQIRGSWTLHQGIVSKWTDSEMDEFIRGFDQWLTKANPTHYLPLNDTEARAETPFPYVVYEVGEPVRVNGDAGTEATQHGVLWQYLMTFTVHARSKSVARLVAVGIANQFENKSLCVTPDEWVASDPVADFCMREGDENWFWRLIYAVRLQAEYLTNRG